MYLGKEYLIKETPSEDAFFNEDSFYINRDLNIFKTLSNIFEKEAYKIIGELLEKKSKEMNLRYNSYRITSAKYQVGACKKKMKLILVSFEFYKLLSKIEAYSLGRFPFSYLSKQI